MKIFKKCQRVPGLFLIHMLYLLYFFSSKIISWDVRGGLSDKNMIISVQLHAYSLICQGVNNFTMFCYVMTNFFLVYCFSQSALFTPKCVLKRLIELDRTQSINPTTSKDPLLGNAYNAFFKAYRNSWYLQIERLHRRDRLFKYALIKGVVYAVGLHTASFIIPYRYLVYSSLNNGRELWAVLKYNAYSVNPYRNPVHLFTGIR